MDSTTRIKEQIAANIAFYRKQNSITQKDLALKLGVKTTTVSTWERASSLPDAETLFELCKIFNIALADIYGCDTLTTKESFPVSELEKDIIKRYRSADSVTKELVHRILGIDLKAHKHLGKIS